MLKRYIDYFNGFGGITLTWDGEGIDADIEIDADEYISRLYFEHYVNQLDIPHDIIVARDTPFIINLYKGFCAEYHLIADLFRINLEGTKLPADLGFDVMATNQRNRMLSGEENVQLFFQVKSRWFDESNWRQVNDERYFSREFTIKPLDMFKLATEKKSYLCCYFINSQNGEIIGYFWISSCHINQFLSEGFIGPRINERGKYEFVLTASYRVQESTKRQITDIINQINTNLSAHPNQELSNLVNENLSPIIRDLRTRDNVLIRVDNASSGSIDLPAEHRDIRNLRSSESNIVGIASAMIDNLEFRYPFTWSEILELGS